MKQKEHPEVASYSAGSIIAKDEQVGVSEDHGYCLFRSFSMSIETMRRQSSSFLTFS